MTRRALAYALGAAAALACSDAERALGPTFEPVFDIAPASAIDTHQFWNGTGEAGGINRGVTIGQSFVATEAALNHFSFWLADFPSNAFTGLTFDAVVMAWDGTQPVGEILFRSGPFVGSNDASFTRYDFPTDGVTVTPGDTYVALLVAAPSAATTPHGNRLGFVGGDPYPGGQSFIGIGAPFVFDPADVVLWIPLPGDLAFIAHFGTGVVTVHLDLKPGSDDNPVNLKSKGRLPAAVLTTEGFDAAQIDPLTLTLGNDDGQETGVAHRKNGTPMVGFEDVDGDGDLDLVAHFETQALVSNSDLTPDTRQLVLRAQTIGGQSLRGSDVVRVLR